jgi:ribonuclease T1
VIVQTRRSLIAAALCVATLIGCGSSTTSTSAERPAGAPADSISIGDLSDPAISSSEAGNVAEQGSSDDTADSDLVTPAECLIDNLDSVSLDELPPQAIDTLELIADDGPFPFDKDGSVFQNRERILPKHERGYYREYTVIDPSKDDRGPRRVVTGECGERLYTDDHYDSFRQIEN